ncbi:MAG: nucleoside triphosphate pyrophosphohydrolase [Oscillospiraceae bacterium]|nr:nucleoside triphosphate pyrophosphohydrolase [Oscillospiraceae bacterium]MCL2278868.1 nucleoside triphosphate pyrophosphohydrolase [Oscillospiraceae bacterium]
MVNFVSKSSYNVSDLVNLMKVLRSPEGCPWDREQTHESIRRNMLEEAYEVAEAIDEKNDSLLLEELGDILMQVVFHADIAESSGRFDFDEIADATCKKLIRRHPHVFGDVRVKDGGESLLVWDDIKRQEKNHETTTDAMNSVAQSLPALWRAEKIQAKAAKVGFDWPDFSGALSSLRSEVQELDEAIASDNNAAADKESYIEEELGDILFSAVNVARFFGIDPEHALSSATHKFISRFHCIEQMAKKACRELSDMTLDEMEELYKIAKLEK